MRNPEITLLETISHKLENEIISRLSELGEQEIGQLTFYFAQRKLADKVDLRPDVHEYKIFVEKEKFKDKRNQFISHKQLPEKWTEHRDIFIPVPKIGKCVALAVRLMIKIDKIFLGPSTIYLWREVLKKKTAQMSPLNVNFLILPYMNLSKEIRKKVIMEEMKEGYKIWEKIIAKVDGVERDVIICKKWGAILMTPHDALVLDDYLIIEITEINFPTIKSSTETYGIE